MDCRGHIKVVCCVVIVVMDGCHLEIQRKIQAEKLRISTNTLRKNVKLGGFYVLSAPIDNRIVAGPGCLLYSR